MDDKPDFKRVLIISAESRRCQGLADILQKYLQGLKFTFLDPVIDPLPDHQYDWLDTDLMVIDLAKNKSAIYQWYSKDNLYAQVPPAIFLAHPASYNDAGSFYRAGAADYLELRGLKSKQIFRSLVFATRMANKQLKTEAVVNHSADRPVSENPFSFDKINPDESEDRKKSDDIQKVETRPEFLNTGVMDILSRDELKKSAE